MRRNPYVFYFVALASIKPWNGHAVDVKSAYLQGNKIEREV